MTALLVSAGAAVVVAAVAMTVTALAARSLGRVVVVDVAWGLALAAVAVTTAVVAALLGEGSAARNTLVAGLVGLWGLRLSWHIHRRSTGAEDPRYEALLGGSLAEVGLGVAVRKVFLVQGAAVCLVAGPVVVGAVLDVAWWPVVVAGALVWLVGVVFEAVGDAQLDAYRRRPRDQRPPVLDSGLWRYTRHPNYFGDACVWWGVWLAAGLGSGWVAGAVTVLAPLAMTWFLVRVTGARLLEETMMKRPAYRDYAARTSMFFPLPPRRRA